MRNKGIALHGLAVVVGGLLATGAMAQPQMASAVPAPQRDFLVFADKGSARVTLIGRPENVAPVKAELQRHGVAAKAIVVKTEAALPVAKTADGLSNPIDRKVEIKF
jgi:hypothetical protein